MKITDVKVYLVDEDKLRAFVSIILDDCFMINDIKVIRGRDGMFISMPSRRKRNGKFKDVAHPLDKRTRSWLETAVLGEFHRCSNAEAAVSMTVEQPAEPLAPELARQNSTELPSHDQETDSLDEIQRRHLSDSFWSVG